MNNKQREILVITQEECAEVIQEISKIFRFGINETHKDGCTHKEKFALEIADLLTMIDLVIQEGLIDTSLIDKQKQAKIDKLKIYSSIFQNN